MGGGRVPYSIDGEAKIAGASIRRSDKQEQIRRTTC
jgi:hypothetical protein